MGKKPQLGYTALALRLPAAYLGAIDSVCKEVSQRVGVPISRTAVVRGLLVDACERFSSYTDVAAEITETIKRVERELAQPEE